MVHVSIVNWQKGGDAPATRVLWLDDATTRMEVAEISSALSPRTDLRTAAKLDCNAGMVTQGQTHGVKGAFQINGAKARAQVRREPAAREVIHPAMGGKELLRRLTAAGLRRPKHRPAPRAPRARQAAGRQREASCAAGQPVAAADEPAAVRR